MVSDLKPRYARSIPGVASTVAAARSGRHVRYGLGHRRRRND